MKLKDYLQRRKIPLVRFASLLGVTQSYVSFLVNDKRKPSFAVLAKIYKLTHGKVGLKDFIDE